MDVAVNMLFLLDAADGDASLGAQLLKGRGLNDARDQHVHASVLTIQVRDDFVHGMDIIMLQPTA